MVKICCIGAGYVGGATMAVIAQKCPEIDVTVVDISGSRVSAWNSDELPIHDPGLRLHRIVRECRENNNNLLFSADVERHVAEADMVFVCVDTPAKSSGVGAGRAADLSEWEAAARTIAKVSGRRSEQVVVERSAVPVRTAEAMERLLSQNSGKFEVLSNPEFFAGEGSAVDELLNPDRVLIGGRDTERGREAVRSLKALYSRWVPQDRILTASLWSAELSKLASNAFLAQRISSINSLSALCEATGADVSQVSRAIGKDTRIGEKFLKASVGFEGSCFQKDILNLVYICECNGLKEVADYWRGVIEANEYQKSRFVRRVVWSMFNTVSEKKIAILGLAFERESPEVHVCRGLLGDGARLSVYDPRLSEERIKRDLKLDYDNDDDDRVIVACDAYEATREAHGICILTEWDEFKRIDYKRVFESMKKPAFVFDGNNVVDVHNLRHIGFIVYSIGKPLDPWLRGMPPMP